MSEIITFPLPLGPNYTIPDIGDENWGQEVTNFLVAIPAGVLGTQGSFPLTGDVNLGSTYGFVAAHFISSGMNPALSGFLRLDKTDTLSWRNNANTADLALSISGSDQLLFNSVPLSTVFALTNNHIFVGNVSNIPTDVAMSGDVGIVANGTTTIQAGAVTASKIASNTITDTQINASAAIAYSKLNLTNSILNADINSSAAVDWAKMASGGTYTLTGQFTILPGSPGLLSLGAAPTGSNSEYAYLEIVNDTTGTLTPIIMSTYGSAAEANTIHYYRAGGSVASPSATTSGMLLSSTGWRGYANGAFTNSALALECTATEDWTATANGCQFQFQATPTGSGTRTPVLTIGGSGLIVNTGGIFIPSGVILFGTSGVSVTINPGSPIGDRVWTIPELGRNPTFAAVTQSPIQAASTTAFTTTSNSPQSTNLTASITPVSASNRIKVTVYGMLGSQAIQTSDALMSIFRGSTNLATNYFAIVEGNISGNIEVPCSITCIDSPATTSSTTYTVKIWADVGSATVEWGIGSSSQVMILEEII